MNCDKKSEPWKSFWLFVYAQTAEGRTNDSLAYLFESQMTDWRNVKEHVVKLTLVFLNHRTTTARWYTTSHLLEVNVVVQILVESTKQSCQAITITIQLSTHALGCLRGILWIASCLLASLITTFRTLIVIIRHLQMATSNLSV